MEACVSDLLICPSRWLHPVVSSDQQRLPAFRFLPSCNVVFLPQIISKGLAARTPHFPDIITSKKVSPSFFDAPAAAISLLPDGNVFRSLEPQPGVGTGLGGGAFRRGHRQYKYKPAPTHLAAHLFCTDLIPTAAGTALPIEVEIGEWTSE